MKTVTAFAEVRRDSTGSVALVPTMGFLHDGHVSLLRQARTLADTVVMSLFVNPLQFNDERDLDRYPRDVARDAELAAAAGVDMMFVPDLEEMYPVSPVTRVGLTGVTDRMEGAHRSGHFDGVATVVAKLFVGIQPDQAVFGRKDAQQLAVIRTMVRDLSFPVQIVPGPTVRERDGIALSSRNVFLDGADRVRAQALSRGLFAAADQIEAGERSGPALEATVGHHLSELDVDYVELADQVSAERLDRLDRPAFLAVAARVGHTRLIDNIAIDASGGAFVVDRGVRLDGPSLLDRT